LTMVVLVSILLLVTLTLLIRPLMRLRLEEKFDRGAENQSYLVETVTGIQTVKAMALEPIMNRKWETLLARYVGASFRASYLSSLGGAAGQIVQRGSTLAVLWVGANAVMTGDLTVGELIAFQMLSGRAITPVMRVVKMWQDFQQIGLSVERLGDIINTKPEPVLSAGKAALPAIKGAVKLENVRFRYRADGPEALRGLSFDIDTGMTVGIVGRSGSGKSTVALQQTDPMWLRRQIGVVLQENLLFNGTLRENIAIHLPGVPMTRVIEVAKLAGAHEFILELQDGYDTPVGERGTALSGGQRQRIAIARALLADPRILIFDEATSALDVESERVIQANLARICAGRTVFMIAHRLSTIRHADRILVMERGELAEHGSHDELMAQRGIYHHLVQQQYEVVHENRVA
jgi:subfamily B ATP-binding cassette protein HlyB/CyaB